ncbi:MAG TPA: HEAT repeat domain-containing protein [Candidatus Angelobacter sp.]|jgi:hypothetical protein|nr:HEAT repeat domain-containing protein [Candidatus Angelobacter sp.]
MNCNWIKDNLVLYIYEELADDAKYEFEHHVRQCSSCKEEVESALAFKSSMAARPVQEVSPNLLASSRMKLQESLEETQQLRGWNRLAVDLAGWMQQIKLAPALSVALLMIGFAGGALTSYRLGINRGVAPEPVIPAPVTEANIAGIDSVAQDETSKRVVIRYNTLASQTAEGTTDDPRIQDLLVMGTRTLRPDVRLQSIELLNAKSANDDIREALVASLRFDKNPGVRLAVLEGLKGYVRGDVRVRDALVEALIHDLNPGVRTTALGLLNPVRTDTSVHEALKMLAQHDKDDFIRSECKRVLVSTPNMD